MLRSLALLLGLSCLSLAADVGPQKVSLHQERTSPADLQIARTTARSTSPEIGYISYSELLKLPQVAYEISDDSNFQGKTRISGVGLDLLQRKVGISGGSTMVLAICSDGYRAYYPAAYLQTHHPLIVLKINGQDPDKWPKSHDGGDMGPYLISHPTFTPSFRILSHQDEAQIPYGVVRLEFRDERSVYGAIRPRGNYGPNTAVWQGYQIARQNCFRCHNNGEEGGHMAGRPWLVLSAWANADPAHFRAYVRNPRAVNGSGHMPGNSQYDDATLEALRKYFATFIPRSAE